jgi:hypothetical protein
MLRLMPLAPAQVRENLGVGWGWRGEFNPAELDTAIEAALRQGASKP